MVWREIADKWLEGHTTDWANFTFDELSHSLAAHYQRESTRRGGGERQWVGGYS